MAKVMSTPTLRRLNLEARRRKFNRLIPADLIAGADPDGVHVIGGNPFFHGGPVVRCKIWLKLDQTIESAEVTLDIDIGEFNRLKDHRALVE